MDIFRKGKSNFATTLVTGIGTGTSETITLNSTAGLPTDTEIVLTFNRVTSSGVVNPTSLVERIRGKISGSTLTAYTRGVDDTTEQAHSAGTVVEYIWSGADLNDLIDGLVKEHNQDGTHNTTKVVDLTTAQTLTNKTLTSPKIGTGINDTNSNELIKVTATASAVNEITLANAATGGNPTITASGGDSDVGIDFKPKGTGTVRKPSSVVIQVLDGTSYTSVGDGAAYFTIPEELNGMNLVGVHAAVITAGTTNTTDIQIRNVTDSADMLSTKMTIDSGEMSTSTAATPAVIDTSHDDVVTNDLIAVDIDAVSTTPAKGLIVRLRFALP